MPAVPAQQPHQPAAGPQPADGGAGSPGDALKPIADALVTAAKTAGSEPSGDPLVSAALQLGWLMDDVLQSRPVSDFPGDLALPDTTGFDAQSRQLTTLVGQLKLSGVDPAPVVDQLATGAAAPVQATTWQPELAAALFAADIRFIKAYGLGRQLNVLSHETWSETLFTAPPVKGMRAALDALSTALPPHAGRAISMSLERWAAVKAAPAAGVLTNQCELWRALLTGEKKGTELLEPENYLDAAEQLGAKLRATASLTLRQLFPLVVLAGLLFAGGIAVLVLQPMHAGDTATGISGVLAALGLTWKGIGGTVGKLSAKLEAPLWGAEVDGAVTDAVTLVGAPPKRTPTATWSRRRTVTNNDYAGRRAR